MSSILHGSRHPGKKNLTYLPFICLVSFNQWQAWNEAAESEIGYNHIRWFAILKTENTIQCPTSITPTLDLQWTICKELGLGDSLH